MVNVPVFRGTVKFMESWFLLDDMILPDTNVLEISEYAGNDVPHDIVNMIKIMKNFFKYEHLLPPVIKMFYVIK